jgi:hypothetical protein
MVREDEGEAGTGRRVDESYFVSHPTEPALPFVLAPGCGPGWHL